VHSVSGLWPLLTIYGFFFNIPPKIEKMHLPECFGACSGRDFVVVLIFKKGTVFVKFY
jgi:hypothetical protein